jgi:hypothetical protein
MTLRRPRLDGHGLDRGPTVTVLVNGWPRTAHLGETSPPP